MAAPTELSPANALDVLRGTLAGQLPLPSLDPAEYATGHALFEARSDQRARLTAWLVSLLAPRALDPTRVLSIGCGDGSVDVQVAAALAALDQPVDYVGVEPHRPGGRAFTARLGAIRGVTPTVLDRPFAAACPQGPFDVVLAVHSLYYVHDLAATLRRAYALLAPDGVLVVLHAPCGRLNELVRLLAPGRRQEFSDEVVAQLRAMGGRPDVTRIDNRLDLTETGDADTDRRLVDFTVQARLPPQLQRAVRVALADQALPGPGTVVGHPVDAMVLRRPRPA